MFVPSRVVLFLQRITEIVIKLHQFFKVFSIVVSSLFFLRPCFINISCTELQYRAEQGNRDYRIERSKDVFLDTASYELAKFPIETLQDKFDKVNSSSILNP